MSQSSRSGLGAQSVLNGMLSAEGVRLSEAFHQQLIANGTKRTTISSYMTPVRQLLEWCEKIGGPFTDLPSDAIERFYLDLGYDGGNTRRNIFNAALRAFHAWATTNGINIAPLQFPPTVAIPNANRAGRIKKREKESMPDAEESLAHNGETAPVAANEAEPHGPAHGEIEGDPITFHNKTLDELTPEDHAELERHRPALARYAAATQAANIPMPPPGPSIVPPPPMRAGAKSTPQVGTRAGNGKIAASLAGFMLPGGAIRVSRRSDGSDGAQPAEMVLIGQYQEQDVFGYADPHSFVQAEIHPTMSPLRAASTQYQVIRLNEYGQIVPPPFKVVLPTRQAAEPAVGGSSPLETAYLQKLDDLTKRVDDERKQYEGRLEVERKRATESSDSKALMGLLMLQMQRPDSERQLSELKALAVKMRPSDEEDWMGGGNSKRLLMPTTLPAIVETKRPEVEALTQLSTGLMQAFVATKQGTPARDPLIEELLKHVLSQNKTDPALAGLQAEIGRLKDDLSRAREKKSDSLAEVIANMNALDSWADRRGGGGLSGIEVISQIVDKLPETLAAIGKLKAGGVAAPTLKKQPSTGTPVQQQAALPPAAAQAIQALYSATSEQEQEITNAVFALVTALAQGEQPWPKLAEIVVSNLQKEVDTYDEVHSLVVKLFRQCGAKELMVKQPGFATKVAKVVTKNFAVIYSTLFGTEKTIAGFDNEQPATTTNPVQPSAPTNNAPSAAAPSDAPPADEEEEEEEVNDDEELEEEEEVDDVEGESTAAVEDDTVVEGAVVKG